MWPPWCGRWLYTWLFIWNRTFLEICERGPLLSLGSDSNRVWTLHTLLNLLNFVSRASITNLKRSKIRMAVVRKICQAGSHHTSCTCPLLSGHPLLSGLSLCRLHQLGSWVFLTQSLQHPTGKTFQHKGRRGDLPVHLMLNAIQGYLQTLPETLQHSAH
jgi:hypothetical protein